MAAKSYMLDTDTFSYIVKDSVPGIREHFASECSRTRLSSITLAEAVYGARKRKSKRLMSLIELFTEMVPIEPWGPDAARLFGDIRSQLETDGTPIGTLDMMIAASAIASGCILVTNNTAHFSRIKGLKLENWAS